MTDGMDADRPDRGVADPAGSLRPPPPPPADADEYRLRGARSRWVAPAVAVVGVGAAVAFGALWVGISGDLDETEADLEETTADLEVASDRIEALESDVSSAEQAVDESEQLAGSRLDEIEDLERQLDEGASASIRFLGTVLSAGGLAPDDGLCVAGAMFEDQGFDALRLFAASAADDFDAAATLALLDAMATCGVSPGAVGGPQSYGDDPFLDRLHDGCAAGDGAACDELWNLSPAGSEYERFAGTCGDRFATFADAPITCEGEI